MSAAPNVMVTGVPTTVLALAFEAVGGRLGSVTTTVTVPMWLSSLPSFALNVNANVPALAGVYVICAPSLFGLPERHGRSCIAPSVPLPGAWTTENVSSHVSMSVAPSAMGTGVPTTAVAPVSDTIGARLGVVMVMTTLSAPLAPALSVTVRVSVWVPAVSHADAAAPVATTVPPSCHW